MSSNPNFGASHNAMNYVGGISSANTAGISAGGQIAGASSKPPVSFAATAPTGTASKRAGMSSLDRKDRIMNLEQENNTLKEKKNLLESEIKKMETKLRRIEGLMRSRGNLGQDSMYNAQDFQRDLQTEFDNLKLQNEATKEKVRKLHVIQRSLASRPATAAKPNKYAHVQGKLEVSSGKGNSQYTALAEDLRKQLVVNEREILNLQTQLNKLNSRAGGIDGGAAGVDRIRGDIQAMYDEIRAHNVEIENMQANFAQNEMIFKQSKNYTTEIQKKIREVSEQNEQLKMQNSRLQWQTEEAKDLEAEIQKIAEERDQLERTIRNVTAEPFMRKEGQSMQARMAELELKVKEKTRIAQTLREEEAKKAEQANKARAELQHLIGEKNILQGQHAEVMKTFKEKHGNKTGPNAIDAMNGLNATDAQRYELMMQDIATDQAPSWANLPFLSRVDPSSAPNDPKAALQREIDALRLEKTEFAQELEKATNLLKLQTDIERENTQYFQQEIKRLTLIEKSSSAKLEELARRADEKQKMIIDLERKIAPTQTALTGLTRAGAYDDDAQSEFSAITNESELRVDENILDFKVEDAEFFQNVMAVIPALQEYATGSQHKALITLATLDFYNHTTETTQMGEGLNPNYQTQFSFKNKVDDFFVAFLQKQPLKMDIYISKNNSAVHMGHADVLLRPLIEREAATVDSKTPLIQSWVHVYSPQADNQGRPIGQIKYKMRLRKPIQESMRYYREKAEIQNMTRAAQMNVGTLAPPKRLVTIQVLAAHDLQFKYAQVSDVAPFFYYQFFTFDERYSTNAFGTNPRFDDSYSYEVTFDAKAIQYFESENLEIILFDDNAPIQAGATEAGAGDDMIGTCKIPLKSLVAGCSSHSKYGIYPMGSHQSAGQLEVKISVMDLDRVPKAGFTRTVNEVIDLYQGKEWENDLIMRIARPLARLNTPITLLFGVFSRGMRTCTKEDFKYCCRHRLGLMGEISERELDMFLISNEYFKDAEYIESDDFVSVFESSIQQARNEHLNNEALNQTFVRDTSAMMGMTVGGQTQAQRHNQMVNTYNETESLQAMAEALTRGALDSINTEISKSDKSGWIESHRLSAILKQQALIDDLNVKKIIGVIETEGRVELPRFNLFVQKTLKYARDQSAALKKLINGCQRHGKTVVQRLEGQDHNKDGVLTLEGFKAALLIQELAMSPTELTESFYLACDMQGKLFYHEWLLDRFPTYRQFFSSSHGFTGRGESALTERDVPSIDHQFSTSMGINASGNLGNGELDMNRLQGAKAKVETYIRNNEVTLGILFSVLDTDSNKRIDMNEFKNKMRQLHTGLDEEEMSVLFRSMDRNSDRSIAYGELVEMFSEINTKQIIKKMQGIVTKSKLSAETFFNNECREDSTKLKMSLGDFNRLIKSLYERVSPAELVYVQRHFDRGSKGYVSKQEFLSILNQDVMMQNVGSAGFTLDIEDIIKPLATRCRNFNYNVAAVFDNYDRNKNGRLSAEELRDALQKDFSITLEQDEVKGITDFFVNKYKTKEITKTAFIDLLQNSQFKNKADAQEARKSLYDLKQRFETTKTTPQRFLQEANPEKSELITIRLFKITLNNLKLLTLPNINNLTKYMDKKNDGFISIGDFAAEVNNSYNAGATIKSTTRSGKWA